MSTTTIGTLREGHLHSSLKEWYRLPGDLVEERIDGYVVDLVRGALLIEVQTRGFASMKKKVTAFCDIGRPIRVVHPIPVQKTIVKIDDSGTVLSHRRSPKRGSPLDVFGELVSMPDLVGRGLEIELALTVEEEYRHHTPGKSWRRDGWSVVERRLVEVSDTLLLSKPSDLASLIPVEIQETFTTGELALAIGRPRRLAQQMAYCLRKSGQLVSVGKHGNEIVYERAPTL